MSLVLYETFYLTMDIYTDRDDFLRRLIQKLKKIWKNNREQLMFIGRYFKRNITLTYSYDKEI